MPVPTLTLKTHFRNAGVLHHINYMFTHSDFMTIPKR